MYFFAVFVRYDTKIRVRINHAVFTEIMFICRAYSDICRIVLRA